MIEPTDDIVGQYILALLITSAWMVVGVVFMDVWRPAGYLMLPFLSLFTLLIIVVGIVMPVLWVYRAVT